MEKRIDYFVDVVRVEAGREIVLTGLVILQPDALQSLIDGNSRFGIWVKVNSQIGTCRVCTDIMSRLEEHFTVQDQVDQMLYKLGFYKVTTVRQLEIVETSKTIYSI